MKYSIEAFEDNDDVINFLEYKEVKPISVWCTPKAVYLLYENKVQ